MVAPAAARASTVAVCHNHSAAGRLLFSTLPDDDRLEEVLCFLFWCPPGEIDGAGCRHQIFCAKTKHGIQFALGTVLVNQCPVDFTKAQLRWWWPGWSLGRLHGELSTPLPINSLHPREKLASVLPDFCERLVVGELAQHVNVCAAGAGVVGSTGAPEPMQLRGSCVLVAVLWPVLTPRKYSRTFELYGSRRDWSRHRSIGFAG